MKYRIIESEDGMFYPQFKDGFFRSWKMFAHDADTSGWMRTVLIMERDPNKSAKFQTESDAAAFIERLVKKVDAFWNEQDASKARAMQGVNKKRVIDVNKLPKL